MHVRPERSPAENAGCEPHNANEDSPIDTLLPGEIGSVFLSCYEDGPDEAAQFSGDCRDSNMTMFAFIKPKKFVDQTELGLHGNGNDLRWLSLPSSFEDKGSSSIVAVVPGGFDQQTAYVNVAGLGDGAAILSIARGVLRRHESEVGHERAWGSEAPHVTDLDEECEGGEGLDASETAECFYGLSIVRKRCIAFKLCIEG